MSGSDFSRCCLILRQDSNVRFFPIKKKFQRLKKGDLWMLAPLRFEMIHGHFGLIYFAIDLPAIAFFLCNYTLRKRRVSNLNVVKYY